MSKNIVFPQSSNFSELCRFSIEVDALPGNEDIAFHTGHVKYFTPTSLIVLTKICRKRVRKHGAGKVTFYGLSQLSYANNMGFSQALRILGRPFPQRAFGGENYYPLSTLRRKSLETAAVDEGVELGDAIQAKCEEIALVVSQRKDATLQSILAHSFREIFRNVFEHAEVDASGYCVQYWPNTEEVEICIADRGVGVRDSLASNPKLTGLSQREAIYLSLMPGISSKAWRHKKKKAHLRSEWDNSGFGLFFAHQIFGELGWFAIASGASGLIIQQGQPVQDLECDVEGTVVSMRLDLSNLDRIQEVVKSVQARAHEVKQRIGTKSVDFASVEAFLRKETFY